VAGTIIGRSPRIVEIDHRYLDTSIAGHFLIVSNDDRPGIVGAVGTTLGESSVNIANMSLARNKREGHALTVIEVDQALEPKVMQEIKAIPGILSATGVNL
jgi:D-3-phosphoglycerate dehydrogenase